MDPHPNLSYGPRILKPHSRKQRKTRRKYEPYSYGINYRTNTFTQCCGSGSGTGTGGIRNLRPDPDPIRNRNTGFEPDPDPNFCFGSATLHLPHRHKKFGQYDNSGLRVRITLMRIRPGFSLCCESGIGFKIMPSNDKIIYLFLQFDKKNTQHWAWAILNDHRDPSKPAFVVVKLWISNSCTASL